MFTKYHTVKMNKTSVSIYFSSLCVNSCIRISLFSSIHIDNIYVFSFSRNVMNKIFVLILGDQFDARDFHGSVAVPINFLKQEVDDYFREKRVK